MGDQDDQAGHIFDFLGIVYFAQYFENAKVEQIFWIFYPGWNL
jgi:hypothetical protein